MVLPYHLLGFGYQCHRGSDHSFFQNLRIIPESLTEACPAQPGRYCIYPDIVSLHSLAIILVAMITPALLIE